MDPNKWNIIIIPWRFKWTPTKMSKTQQLWHLGSFYVIRSYHTSNILVIIKKKKKIIAVGLTLGVSLYWIGKDYFESELYDESLHSKNEFKQRTDNCKNSNIRLNTSKKIYLNVHSLYSTLLSSIISHEHSRAFLKPLQSPLSFCS